MQIDEEDDNDIGVLKEPERLSKETSDTPATGSRRGQHRGRGPNNPDPNNLDDPNNPDPNNPDLRPHPYPNKF